jgi:membrane associated rhomboid family serine protease
MGMADRDYHRDQSRTGGFASRLTPVVKGLLIANTAVFFLDMFMGHAFLKFGAFAIQSAIFEFRIWEFITFQFLHGSLGHLLFNCIGLFFFGPWMERWWGSRKFLIFYLLCGSAGAVFFTLLTFMGILPGGNYGGLIGASAGIYGIFIGVAVIAPDLRVMLLLPPIELSMRQLAIVMLVISTGSILLKLGGNEGGEAGHLGGAILGFILMRYPRLLGHDPDVDIFHPRQRNPFVSKLRPRTRVELDQESSVDLILDKISREGFQSLTDAEREILQKASGKNHSDS